MEGSGWSEARGRMADSGRSRGPAAIALAGAPVQHEEPTVAPTFAELCGDWLRHGERERQLKPSTLVDYRSSTSARILPALGPLRVGAISAQGLAAWRERLPTEGELSHRTIDKLMMIVGGVLKRARRQGVIAENPTRNLDKLKESRYDDLDFYDPDEVWQLVRAAASQSDAAIFLLLAFSGLRRGEAPALTWRDVDFERELIRFGLTGLTVDWSRRRATACAPSRWCRSSPDSCLSCGRQPPFPDRIIRSSAMRSASASMGARSGGGSWPRGTRRAFDPSDSTTFVTPLPRWL